MIKKLVLIAFDISVFFISFYIAHNFVDNISGLFMGLIYLLRVFIPRIYKVVNWIGWVIELNAQGDCE